MKVLHPCCCGLDVHKETVVACVRLVIDGKPVKEVRTFSTTTADLIALSEWLAETKCTHVAMEATGVYWKPVWHILSDDGFELVLANAIKNVPGRKSDVKDADWISDLLAHGLIRASFVPDGPTQEMRTFLRTRKQFVREKGSHILRIQKTLEDANIKLDSVITDIIGVSGRKMIEALIAGESDPAKLARLADPRVKASQQTLRQALRGRVTGHHRFLLRLHLDQIDALDVAIAKIDQEVEAGIAPFRTAVEQVSSTPGVDPCCNANPLRDRHGHEPLWQRCQSRLLGLHLPTQRRKRRQTPLHAHSQGIALAKDHTGAMRLGGSAQERYLSPRPVPPHQSAARPQEGDRGRRRLDPHGHLSHAQGRNDVPRPRPQPLRCAQQGTAEEPPRQTTGRPRVRCGARTSSQLEWRPRRG